MIAIGLTALAVLIVLSDLFIFFPATLHAFRGCADPKNLTRMCAELRYP